MIAPAVIISFMLCVFFGFVQSSNRIENRQVSQDQSPTGPLPQLKIPFIAYNVDAITQNPTVLAFSVLVGDRSWDRYFCTCTTFDVGQDFEEGAIAGTAPLQGICPHEYPELQQSFLSFRLWQPLPAVVEESQSWQFLRRLRKKPSVSLQGNFNLQLVLTDI